MSHDAALRHAARLVRDPHLRLMFLGALHEDAAHALRVALVERQAQIDGEVAALDAVRVLAPIALGAAARVAFGDAAVFVSIDRLGREGESCGNCGRTYWGSRRVSLEPIGELLYCSPCAGAYHAGFTDGRHTDRRRGRRTRDESRSVIAPLSTGSERATAENAAESHDTPR